MEKLIPRDFDGLMSNTIFCTWTGENMMSERRILGLLSILQNTRCPVAFINHVSQRDWEKPEAPFHPGFDFLSPTQQSDYLRCYLMHHYGGGYTDLKPTFSRWDTLFQRLRESDAYALGYTEVGPGGIAAILGELGDMMRRDWESMIGCGAFIFKKNTALTTAWYEATHRFLDEILPRLRENPARHPMDHLGATHEDGLPSKYPIRWTGMMGDIFHPVIYGFRDRLLHDKIAPMFRDYR